MAAYSPKLRPVFWLGGALLGLAVLILTIGVSYRVPALAQQSTLAVPIGTPAPFKVNATAVSLAPDEQEITFPSGVDTLFGTLLLPTTKPSSGKFAAALLIADSSPTDRDGNNLNLPGAIDSQKFLARTLANAGVASLRYDQFGSGKSGVLSYGSHLQDVGFNIVAQEAAAAYSYLAGRPDIDPARLLILGHGEGGLVGLIAAQQLSQAAHPPKALILAAPMSLPYLTVTRNQIATQVDEASKAGAITAAQAKAILADYDAIAAQVLKDGTLPATLNPPMDALFQPGNVKYLHEIGQYDPRQIVGTLPKTLPVLLLCGAKDSQVLCADVQSLAASFTNAGNTHAEFHQLANVIHVFREVSGPDSGVNDYTDASKPFSTEAAALVQAFVNSALIP